MFQSELCELALKIHWNSSEPHFEPTGSELWPDEVTKPKNFDLNCVEDDELDEEAMAFLNAQNDYFGVGGEHVADNIELNLNFRWDMTRARELCIAHKCPNDFSLMVSFRLSA